MAQAIVAPRRGEPWFVSGGLPTVRFAEYIESSSTVVQEVTTGVVNDVNVTNSIADIEFIDHWRD